MNTVSHDLALEVGALSKTILDAAGHSIQSEVSNKAANGLNPGEMVISSGGNLGCKKIYHVALQGWDSPNGKQAKVVSYLIKYE